MNDTPKKLFVLIATVDVENDPDLVSYGSWTRFTAEVLRTLGFAGDVHTVTYSLPTARTEPACVVTGAIRTDRFEKVRILMEENRKLFPSTQIKLTIVDSYEFL